VLGLPHAFSYLGWGPGLFLLATLCATSIYTSHLLSHLHEDPDGDKRYNTYREIGEAVWGPRYGKHIVESVQFTLMIGLCITYSVTAGQSIKGIVDDECDGADCEDGLAPWIVLFGVAQLLLSQVPDFHSLWWISLLGAAMSVGYCCIAAAASTAAAINSPMPPPMTRPNESEADHFFGVLNALGGIAFTFGGQAVLPEIQATLARPPKTYTSMMKGIAVAYVVVILAYFSVAISGYAAYGATVRPDVLLSISHPVPLIDAANLMVVLHVAAGYQIFGMPLFEIVEEAVREKYRPHQPPRPVVLRLILRSAFVCGTTLVACLVPFFGELMGLIAAVGLMPITFILPPLLWVSSRKPQGAERVVCISIAVVTSILALLSLIGSMRNIIVNWQNF
jgi:amino acid permease